MDEESDVIQEQRIDHMNVQFGCCVLFERVLGEAINAGRARPASSETDLLRGRQRLHHIIFQFGCSFGCRKQKQRFVLSSRGSVCPPPPCFNVVVESESPRREK